MCVCMCDAYVLLGEKWHIRKIYINNRSLILWNGLKHTLTHTHKHCNIFHVVFLSTHKKQGETLVSKRQMEIILQVNDFCTIKSFRFLTYFTHTRINDEISRIMKFM